LGTAISEHPDHPTAQWSGRWIVQRKRRNPGDLDGDGQLDLVLKWDPSNSKDSASSGKSDDCIIDGYKMDGTRLWRIDLGVNIRAGAHDTQMSVYDFDGDGKAELAVKTGPGTKDGKGNYLKKGPAAGADNTQDLRGTRGMTWADRSG